MRLINRSLRILTLLAQAHRQKSSPLYTGVHSLTDGMGLSCVLVPFRSTTSSANRFSSFDSSVRLALAIVETVSTFAPIFFEMHAVIHPQHITVHLNRLAISPHPFRDDWMVSVWVVGGTQALQSISNSLTFVCLVSSRIAIHPAHRSDNLTPKITTITIAKLGFYCNSAHHVTLLGQST